MGKTSVVPHFFVAQVVKFMVKYSRLKKLKGIHHAAQKES